MHPRSVFRRSVFREDEDVMLNMNPSVPVTSAAGTSSGYLVIGRDDGSLLVSNWANLIPLLRVLHWRCRMIWDFAICGVSCQEF
ncbi:hypothetical protein DVH24_010305 [Malus domestica]|uniref:Uncharacterized protein n=1 Tax=Malus domestica TaxID=3750 RepID=A0A498JRC2_MALDO|nr:hypothetical protein DVH24_010305 [Malus domestica]